MSHTTSPATMESCDEVKPIKYLDVYPKLPIDAPIGHPHIIDLDSLNHENYHSQKISIADAVVTILFKVMPAALTAFFAYDRPNFLFIQAGIPGSRLDFCIKREGRMVAWGFLNENQVGGWSCQYRYRIDGKATGGWTPIGFRSGGGVERMDAVYVQEKASHSALWMLYDDPLLRDTTNQHIELICGLSHGRAI